MGPSTPWIIFHSQQSRLLFLIFLSTDNRLVSFVGVSSSPGSVASFASFISARSFVSPVEMFLAVLLPPPGYKTPCWRSSADQESPPSSGMDKTLLASSHHCPHPTATLRSVDQEKSVKSKPDILHPCLFNIQLSATLSLSY